MSMLIAAFVIAVSSGPVVENWKGGETVPYPLVIIDGKAEGSSVTVNTVEYPVVDGRFVATVELERGGNLIVVTDTEGRMRALPLFFKEPETPFKVRSYFIIAEDEQPVFQDGKGGLSSEYEVRIDTMMKLIQSMSAEMMRVAGYGRKTFALDLDEQGKVIVRVMKYPDKGDNLRALDGNTLWSKMYQLLGPVTDPELIKNCVIAGYSRWDVETQRDGGGAALGGGYLGYFGSGSVYTWPVSPADIATKFLNGTRLDKNIALDDSAYRATVWGSASTTIGAVLHEMGHTFGLPHTIDGQGIMSRGFDFTNRWFAMTEPPSGKNKEQFTITQAQRPRWSKAYAALLDFNPWFQPEAPRPGNEDKPSAELTEKTVKVSAPAGLAVVVAHADGNTDWLWKAGPGAPTTQTFDLEAIRESVGTGAFRLFVVDRYGRRLDLQVPAEPSE